MSRYTQPSNPNGRSREGSPQDGALPNGKKVIRYSRRSYPPPKVSLPYEAPEEIDEQAENRVGSRSRKRVPKPLRFFPHLFPVPTTLYGIMTVIGGALLVAALIYQVREVVSPFLLMLAIIILFHPFRKEPKLRPIYLLGVVVFIIWFFGSTIGVLFPFILAFIMAYMAEPLVAMVSRRWYISRGISALVLTLLFVAIIAVAIGYMTPVLIAQVGTAVSSLERATLSMVEWAQSGALREITGIPQEKINAMIDKYLLPRLATLDASLLDMAGDVGSSVPDYLTGLMHFLMVPFVMFYFIKDYWRIRGAIYSFMPQEYQRRMQSLLRDLDQIVGGYLRGDLITSVFQGAFIGVGLYLIGVPGALLLGVLTGFLCLIPFIGAYIAYALALMAGLNTEDPALSLLYVTGLFLVQAVIESTVIGPQIMGRHTDLHPILVIISLLVFGYFMGIPGMLVAIPVTSLLIRFAMRWRDARRVEIEQQKVEADLQENPHHARKGEALPEGARS